jgi:hypothetical protein
VESSVQPLSKTATAEAPRHAGRQNSGTQDAQTFADVLNTHSGEHAQGNDGSSNDGSTESEPSLEQNAVTVDSQPVTGHVALVLTGASRSAYELTQNLTRDGTNIQDISVVATNAEHDLSRNDLLDLPGAQGGQLWRHKPLGLQIITAEATKLIGGVDHLSVEIPQDLPGQTADVTNGSDVARLLEITSSGTNNPFGDTTQNKLVAIDVGRSTTPPGHIQSTASGSTVNLISTSLFDNRWTTDFSQQITWLIKSDISSAQISVNPAELGPIHITLNIVDDQATAAFVSAHEKVRSVIENALGELRETLQQNGVHLTDAHVGSHANSQREHAQTARLSRTVNSSSGTDSPLVVLPGRLQTLGKIDVFA